MIDSSLLIPPGYGPTANPVLFGVSDALARLFPVQVARASDEAWAAASAERGVATQAVPARPCAPGMPTTA